MYQSAVHHGLMSSSFVTTFLAMIGMTSGRTNKLWRSRLVNGVSELLRTPRIHARFATSQGDAAMAGLRALLKLHHDPHPWDDLWREIAVEHPLRDEWREERSMIPFFDRIQVPAYLGCDWENVPLHLPGSLAVIEPGSRSYMTLGGGLNRARASAADTAWIATLQDVAPDGTGTDITSGCLRASLRAVDEKASTPGAPVLPCTTATAVPVNQQVSYRVPIVGTSTLNRIASTCRLLLPVAAGTLA